MPGSSRNTPSKVFCCFSRPRSWASWPPVLHNSSSRWVRLPRRAEPSPSTDEASNPLWPLCLVRGRDALAHLVFQLRGPRGHLLSLSAAPARDAPDAGRAGVAWVVVRLGLWSFGTLCGQHCGPRPPKTAILGGLFTWSTIAVLTSF